MNERTEGERKTQFSSERSGISSKFATFDIADLQPQEQFAHFEAFKRILAETLEIEEGQQLDIEEVLESVFEKVNSLTTEELIGLSLYMANLLLLHGESLGEDAPFLFVDKTIRLIELSLETKNVTSLFFSLEVIELLGESPEITENLGLFVSVMRMVSNSHITGKVMAIILNQGRSGQIVATKLLDEETLEGRGVLLHIGLYLPGVVRSSIIPLLIKDVLDKGLPLSRRNQAAALLSRLGILLDDEVTIGVISHCFKTSLADSTLLASALVTSGSVGKKEFVNLLKSPISSKLKSILCMYMRELSPEGCVPTLVIDICEDPDRLQILEEKNPSYSWHFEGEVFSRMNSAPAEMRFPPEPSLVFSRAEAEAIFRQCLIPVQEDQYRKHTFFRGRERLLLVHSVLFSGSKNIGKPSKIPRAIIQLLGEQLEDEDPAVREAALNSIGSIGIPDIEPLLFRVEQ
jgi:hypothetical protein